MSNNLTQKISSRMIQFKKKKKGKGKNPFLTISSPLQMLLVINFSSRTTSMDIQRNLETNVEKRTKDTYGPPMGKRLIVFMDDMNMPRVSCEWFARQFRNIWGGHCCGPFIYRSSCMKTQDLVLQVKEIRGKCITGFQLRNFGTVGLVSSMEYFCLLQSLSSI